MTRIHKQQTLSELGRVWNVSGEITSPLRLNLNISFMLCSFPSLSYGLGILKSKYIKWTKFLRSSRYLPYNLLASSYFCLLSLWFVCTKYRQKDKNKTTDFYTDFYNVTRKTVVGVKVKIRINIEI